MYVQQDEGKDESTSAPMALGHASSLASEAQRPTAVNLQFSAQQIATALSAPPTTKQLHELRAVASRNRGGQGGKRAKNGRIVAKFFNDVASRPYPRVGSLEQSIRVTFEFSALLFQTSTTIPVFSSSYYTLSNFPDYAKYTALFDQYRFDHIEVWLESRAAQGATAYDTVASCVDLDDANVPTSFEQVTAKQGSLMGTGGAGRYHAWQPHMAVALFSGAFTSYGNEAASWIDSASPNVQHYGLKSAASPTGIAIYYVQVVRATVTFRSPGI